MHVPHPPSMRTDDGKYFTHEKDSWAKSLTKIKLITSCRLINLSNQSLQFLIGELASDIIRLRHFLLIRTAAYIRQNISYILPQLVACAEYKKQIQTRTFGGHAHARQIGYNFLRDSDLITKAEQSRMMP